MKHLDGAPFSGCFRLTNVFIEEGVEVIGTMAFDGCESLSFLRIPNSVTKIDNYAFNGCKNLNKLLIGDYVIRGKSLSIEL